MSQAERIRDLEAQLEELGLEVARAQCGKNSFEDLVDGC